MLVGCDGINSVVRWAMFPSEGPPKWNGITMWRAVTEGAPFLSGRTMVMIEYAARQMVVYPISRRHEVEQRAPDGFVDLETVISLAELEEISRSYKRTAGFYPEVLNNRPSLGVGQRSGHNSQT